MIEGKQAMRPQDEHGDAVAEEALEAARNMPPCSERNTALKKAEFLRRAADSYGVIFARCGRPTG